MLNGLCSFDDDHSTAVERLREAIRKEPDAVAFGCINGKWVAVEPGVVAISSRDTTDP